MKSNMNLPACAGARDHMKNFVWFLVWSCLVHDGLQKVKSKQSANTAAICMQYQQVL
jgi:hypothetical protein